TVTCPPRWRRWTKAPNGCSEDHRPGVTVPERGQLGPHAAHASVDLLHDFDQVGIVGCPLRRGGPAADTFPARPTLRGLALQRRRRWRYSNTSLVFTDGSRPPRQAAAECRRVSPAGRVGQRPVGRCPRRVAPRLTWSAWSASHGGRTWSRTSRRARAAGGGSEAGSCC